MRYLHPILLTFALLLALLMIASPSQATVATEITVERFVYDGQVSFDYDEYVKICNISGGSINLGGTNPWRIGDDESADGDDEAMYALQGTLAAGDCFIIASNANAFNSIWGFLPDYEMRPTAGSWGNNTTVPDLTKVGGSSTWGLNNDGDNITLWKYNTGTDSYERHDEVAYGTNSNRYTEVGLPGGSGDQISGCGNAAVTRNNVATDTDNMANDFNCTANPNAITLFSLIARSEQSTAPSKQALAAIFRWSLTALLGLAAMGASIIAFRRQRGA